MFRELQPYPEAVQKFAFAPPPRQQACPAPPHAVLLPPPELQPPAEHVPRLPPHWPAAATHFSLAQHEPAAAQVDVSQHG